MTQSKSVADQRTKLKKVFLQKRNVINKKAFRQGRTSCFQKKEMRNYKKEMTPKRQQPL